WAESSPSVGFNPTTPFMAAGHVIDPSVSVPTLAGAYPAAIAAALPELEPHGLRSSTCGFFVKPPTALQPLIECSERKFAHSLKFAFPRMIAPAARRFAITGASRRVILEASASDPAVVAVGSADSMLSLTRIGMP